MKNIRKFGVKQWRFVLLSLAIIGLIGTLIGMGREVREHVKTLEAAPHDAFQWTLSQLNVEHTKLKLAIVQAMQSPDQDLEPLRRRFDIYYSRSQTMTSLRSSTHLRPDKTLYGLLTKLQNQTFELAEIVDQPDAELRKNLPNLLEQIQKRSTFLQTLSSRTIALFATASDNLRSELSKLLIEFVVVAFLLAISFLSVAFFLYRSMREAKAMQANLANVTARLQSTIGASLDAVIVCDLDGMLLDYNGAAEHIFGYAREEVLGKSALKYLMPEGHRIVLRDEILRHLDTGYSPMVGEGKLELKGLKKNGEIIPIEISIIPVADRDDTIFISFVRDISEQLAIKENLLSSRDEAVKMSKAKSDFIAIMSHEMRTPLNGVIAAHEVLLSTDLTPYQNKFFSIARSSAEHLLSHVNEVLDIATMETAAPQPRDSVFNPLAAIEEVIENAQTLARARGNSLGADFTGADTNYYLGDEGRFRRILINLLGNAIKFTQNGHIQIDYGTFALGNGAVCLELHVADNGRGIPQDKLDDIFNDFVRLDAEYDRDTDGTGLGLSITRRMVDALGGELGVESEVDVGSTFWVTLPLKQCAQPSLEHDEKSQQLEPFTPHNFSGFSVLLVEDNAINRTIMLQILEDVGLEVTTAENGKVGVEKAQKAKFDYIFMDVSMPILDGISATKILRAPSNELSAGAKIIGFTAHSSKKSREECLAAGMDEVLVKPVSRADIISVVTNEPNREAIPSSEDELVDWQQIESIRDILGPERFSQTCTQFRTELRQGFQELLQDVTNTPEGTPRNTHVEQIHKLAGLSASMGARELHKKLENAQSVAELAQVSNLREELERATNCLELTLGSDAYKSKAAPLDEATERTR